MTPRQRATERAERYAQGLCRDCPNPRATGYKWCDPCLAKNRARQQRTTRAHDATLRTRVFSRYGGPTCACCGTTTVLTLDLYPHGPQSRSHPHFGPSNASRDKLYHWLTAHSYPPGYAIFCANCARTRALYGACTHPQQPAKEDVP